MIYLWDCDYNIMICDIIKMVKEIWFLLRSFCELGVNAIKKAQHLTVDVEVSL